MKKHLSFIKNTAISACAAVAMGVGCSELANYFTNDGKIIGMASTLSQYVAAKGVFLPLHARDNKEIYVQKEKFNWKEFIGDNLKFTGGVAVLNLLYLFSRPFIQDHFIEQGMNVAKASLSSDMWAMGIYYLLAIPIARATGLTKGKKDLEKILLKEKNEKRTF